MEDSLAKVQHLQEAAAAREEGFRQELESSRRLAELQSQQAETHRNRLKDVESALEQFKDEAAEEMQQAQKEMEYERFERDKLEHRVAELEAEIDRLETTAHNQPPAGSVPTTPRQGLNGSVYGRAGSPAQFGTPGSIRSRSAMTATQAIEELFKVKNQLAAERKRSERLTAELDSMMEGLEAKQPEIEELQLDHERLQQEMIQMSELVDKTGKEKDRLKKEARKSESEAATAKAESNILRQQMRDLSAQIKLLVFELDTRERGLGALNAQERAQLERLARGEVAEGALEGLTATDRLISERLVVFRSISEVQEKNQELLKIVRELGAKMESDESLEAKRQAAQDHEQVKSLEKRIESYQDELQSMITRSESYMKERDMFRRMLQHRGPLPQNTDLASMFGQSVDGGSVIGANDQSQANKDSANMANLLRELQSHFDQYREEQTTDRRTMKEQMDRLTSEKGALQSELAKATSQLTLANERYEMLQANYNMLQSENAELQKRSHILSEAAAKQDLRTQQVAEDLIEAKGLVESLRNENSNLKAEKKLWREIQDRLNQDNENLKNERNQLSTLLTSQQNIQNERELSESETRRRLQAQVDGLENELNSTKRKLNDEIEESKKAHLRREYDAQQTQKRADDLVSALATLREELMGAKTSRDHLQARVEELTIELKSAEERVQVLQPRPTPRPGTHTADGNTGSTAEDAITREQELAIEVSELKRDLDLAKTELENSKTQMEQYRSIAQDSEEELRNFTETQDAYRQEMDGIIEEKDREVKGLQQRVEEISTEMTALNNELNAIREQRADLARRAAEDKVGLEAEIVRLKDEDERHAAAAQFYQQDLRAQAEIAAKAQQDYEHELVKHAEAAKLLQELRGTYNILKTESAGLKAEAESAKVALSQSQMSWEERREQFEIELKELRTRYDEVGAQNKLLLRQLEDLNSQVSQLQQRRTESAVNGEPTAEGLPSQRDSTIEGLQELVTYLRREKDIVEVQHNLAMQESKRFKQQLDYVQSQLDETRLKLDQERATHADGSRVTMAHQDLMEKLNELNLFRESSITLRNEARQAQAQLAEKTKQLEELMETIQPLETKVRELENMKEMQEGEIRLLQEDRDRWQKRNQEILSKYDRIDPAEMEQLKAALTALQVERDALSAGQQPLQEKVDALEGEKVKWTEGRAKLIEQFKERSRVITKDRNERTAERDAAVREKEELEGQLSTLRQQLETAIQEKETSEQQLAAVKQELEKTIQEKEAAEQRLVNLQLEVSATKPTAPDLSTNDEAMDTDQVIPAGAAIEASVPDEQLAAIQKELEAATGEKNDVEQQLIALRQELETLRTERDEAIASLEAYKKLAEDAKTSGDEAQEGLEEGQVNDVPQSAASDAEKKALEERIAAAETKAREEEAKVKELQENMDAIIKQRSDKMKTLLNNKLQESRAALETEFKTKLEEEKQRLQSEHESTTKEAVTTKEPPSTPLSAQTPATPTTTISTASLSTELRNMSDAQLRELLATNATAKSILQSNLRKRLDIETQKIKEELEKSTAERMADAAKKADESKAQAVNMEGKKSVLKLNMADNKLKAANAKLEVVETAAKETPQRPVGEVWEIAKNAKPPQNAAPAPVPGQYFSNILNRFDH